MDLSPPNQGRVVDVWGGVVEAVWVNRLAAAYARPVETGQALLQVFRL